MCANATFLQKWRHTTLADAAYFTRNTLTSEKTDADNGHSLFHSGRIEHPPAVKTWEAVLISCHISSFIRIESVNFVDSDIIDTWSVSASLDDPSIKLTKGGRASGYQMSRPTLVSNLFIRLTAKSPMCVIFCQPDTSDNGDVAFSLAAGCGRSARLIRSGRNGSDSGPSCGWKPVLLSLTGSLSDQLLPLGPMPICKWSCY